MSPKDIAAHGEQTEPQTVRITRVLPAPIERVWAYLTESDKRAKWFAGGAFDLRVGGRTEFRFNHGALSHEPNPEKYKQFDGATAFHGEIIAIDPPRLLAWKDSGDSGLSEVRFELTPKGGKTLLVITNTRLSTRKDRVGNASGWDAHLNILEDVLNGVAPRGFWTMHAKLEAHYDKALP